MTVDTTHCYSVKVSDLTPGSVLASGHVVESVSQVNRLWGGTMIRVDLTNGSSGVVGTGVSVLVRR